MSKVVYGLCRATSEVGTYLMNVTSLRESLKMV